MLHHKESMKVRSIMSYDMYRYIFIISTCISIVLLVLSVFLFIKLDIPKIIKDLLGINAKRAIENIRTENEKSGERGLYLIVSF